ncbi:DNA repair protein RadC [Candidatus Nomurabacteria bacterium]|nr:DNA repair protein RadC [Candidatus Nomurabacteria bacterium]
MRKIKDIAKIDRPREKLKAKGPGALSDFELLQALIGSGNKQADVGQIAKELNKLLQKFGANVTYGQLEQITGLGSAKITELLSAIELSKRYLTENEQPILDSPEKVVEQLKDIRDKKQEYFVCITLDGANRMISKRTITIGTLTASLVHPREVFADAITDRAASIIVAHNHPSGSTVPSKADIDITNRLLSAGELLGITLLEHIIVSKTDNKHIKLY